MSLVQKLHSGKIDLIGDIHGEIDALVSLVSHLGYDSDGYHPDGRKMVFVGDLCDRGPDTPAVLKLVKSFVDLGNAQMVLGNHELNLLQGKAKDGAGWYFSEREIKDANYEPFSRVAESDREELLSFISNLPVVLENNDLRVVHAAWVSDKVDMIREYPLGSVREVYNRLETSINQSIVESGLLDAYKKEQQSYKNELEDSNYKNIPFLETTAAYNLKHQMNNPLRVLTSGVEQLCSVPFYASGKWRFVERNTWWESYDESVPVVVGHFWRKMKEDAKAQGEEDVFAGIQPLEWHGKHNNVFCVDFSVGGRFKERLEGKVGDNTCLVALRWPEKTLMLEDGTELNTSNFLGSGKKLNEELKNNKPKRSV